MNGDGKRAPRSRMPVVTENPLVQAAELEERAMTILRTCAVMQHEALRLMAKAALLREER